VLSTKQLQNNNFQIGFLGERLALEYLDTKGYTVLATNLAWGKLELDILAKTIHQDTSEHMLICIEVKTRVHPVNIHHNQVSRIPTYMAYSKQKHKALSTIARQIIKRYKWTGLLRFDLITVDLELQRTVTPSQIQIKNKKIVHYKHVMGY
jgi:Holliday junction resolvase-like predicted endonuclease